MAPASRAEPPLVFVARQPILDAAQRLYGYELLFRASADNHFGDADQDFACARVIADSVSLFGLQQLTAGRYSFLNVTRRALLERSFALLPPERTVVELLETVEPDDAVLASCRELKALGFRLALDDFRDEPPWQRVVPLADFLKVDLRAGGRQGWQAIASRYGHRITLLAEKVETREEFETARRLGFRYFQGYFFCKPQVLSQRDVPAYKTTYLRWLSALARPELDYAEICGVLESDPSLAARLLRLLNSAAFPYHGGVRSLRQAVLLLGERSLRQWAAVVALAGLAQDHPNEIVVTSLVRARMAEALAWAVGLGDRAPDLFLAGLLSLIGVLFGRPDREVLSDIALAGDLKEALLGKPSSIGKLLSLTVAYERGDWERVADVSAELGVSAAALVRGYEEAARWASEVVRGEGSLDQEPPRATPGGVRVPDTRSVPSAC
jgi:EAL and modified HD-GYP domain-containing signal transduction protein